MNVAAKHHHTGLIENHRRARYALIQAQLKAFSEGERIDVMTDIVAIGERHRGATAHCQHSWRELLRALIHYCSSRCNHRCNLTLQAEHGIGQGLSLAIHQLGLQAGGVQWRTEQQHAEQ